MQARRSRIRRFWRSAHGNGNAKRVPNVVISSLCTYLFTVRNQPPSTSTATHKPIRLRLCRLFHTHLLPGHPQSPACECATRQFNVPPQRRRQRQRRRHSQQNYFTYVRTRVHGHVHKTHTHTHTTPLQCAQQTRARQCSSFPPAAGKTADLRTAVQLPAAPVEFSSRVPSKSN